MKAGLLLFALAAFASGVGAHGTNATAADGGFLTTHVLDTYSGSPAAGVQIDFFAKDGESYKFVKSMTTNADGRTDAPIMPKEGFATGSYQLVFHVGEYYAKLGIKTAEPPFLDRVPVQFSVSDGKAHYQVPLLTSPWSYTTYRGS